MGGNLKGDMMDDSVLDGPNRSYRLCTLLFGKFLEKMNNAGQYRFAVFS